MATYLLKVYRNLFGKASKLLDLLKDFRANFLGTLKLFENVHIKLKRIIHIKQVPGKKVLILRCEKILNKAGGILCLLLLFLLVQGMLYISDDSVIVSVKQNSQDESTEIEEEKIAYLTFDDGPSVLTKEYLSVLKEEDVKATFFLIGQQVEGDMVDVVKQEIEEGHEIGIHTYCHKANQIYASKESYCQDLEKTKLCLSKKLNIEPKLYRFPWGSANAYVQSYKEELTEEMKEEGLEYADWNVSGEDSVGCPSVSSILSNVCKDYPKYNDPVLLLHDSATCRATLEALPTIIKELKEKGYSFQTLSERKTPCHFG